MPRRQSFEFDPDSHPLAPALIVFNRGNGWYRALLGSPEQTGWILLADLAQDDQEVDSRLKMLENSLGGRAGLAAGALLGQVAHPTFSAIAWCLLIGNRAPIADPSLVSLRDNPQAFFDRVSFAGDFVAIEGEIESHPDLRRVATQEELLAKSGRKLVACIEPLINAIRRVRRVGVPGLWKGIADIVGQACLAAGSATGSVATGQSLAEAILTRAPDQIRTTPRWFQDDASRMWFVLRSVCCLAYTGTSGLYCDTCPLLSDDEIAARLSVNRAGST